MVVPIWYHPSVDVNVKGLDPEVLDRLAQQAEAEGVSRQEWIRQVLGRTAAPLSPAELVADAGGLLVLAGLL
ncbi:MAG: ribbon-helix-helix domain-containing protein [Actinomycetota bacterium]|nr:ribbon-helix-helix domain-containing protein [Actinomycetota bacterium]